MDIKNTAIGLLFIAAAIYIMVTSGRQQQQLQDSQTYAQKVETAAPGSNAAPSQAEDAALKSKNSDAAPEEYASLQNDYVKVVLTNKGGAIRDVELLRFKESQSSDSPYIFNDGRKALGMGLAFDTAPDGAPITFEKSFRLAKTGENLAVYEYLVPGKIRITRAYSLEAPSSKKFIPYVINTATRVENLSGETMDARRMYLCLGMAVPNAGDVYGTNLAFGLYNGDKARFETSTAFVDSSGFLGIGASKAKPFVSLDTPDVAWGAVKNQFFSAVFTPDGLKGSGGFVEPILIDPDAENKYMQNGIAGFMGFDAPALKPGESAEISGSYYVGPKELSNLVKLGGDQELVMNFGWMGFISKPLLVLLTIINSVVEYLSPSWSWGWSIIILTIFVRLCLWPLTAVQIRSSLKMSKLQEPLAEIRKKYEGDQQRIGQETMKLYGEYGINPLAGCFPLLIQLPIFLGLYYMLQTSSEIRFAHFLWIQDLSLPDYIPGMETVFGFPFHPLPIINAAVTYVQMHITPMPSTDKSQKMIFKLMPFIMLLFFYTFPSGLVLYWTVQSLIGVIQAVIINRSREKFVIKKRDTSKPGFMQRLSEAMQEQAKLREAQKSDILRGTMHDTRKKNPGGRSTPPKRK